MDERTTRDFRFKGDLWSIVNEWAQDNGYFISNLSPGATNRHWYKIDKWAGFLDSLHGRRELEISLNSDLPPSKLGGF